MSVDSINSSWHRPVAIAARTFIAVVLILGLSYGRPVLIPIALATLLTFLLNPAVRALQNLGLGRLVSVILAVTTVGIGVTTLGAVGSRQISALLAELPANTAKIKAKVRTLKAVVSGPTALAFEDMIEEISREFRLPSRTVADDTDPTNANRTPVVEAIIPNSERSWVFVTGYLGSAFEAMAMFAFALVLLVFFLLEREGLRDRIVLLAGKTRLTLTSKALEDATHRVSRYIVMVATVNGGFGVLMTLGLLCLGVPYAILWGCVAALLRFIPYIGPWIGAFFPIIMSVALSEGWWQPVSVFIFVMALELMTNNAVEPIVFGRTTGVAPVQLLISAAFWLYLWGPVGLILSAPFAVCLVVIGKNIPQLRFLNVLLGDEPVLNTDVEFYQRLLAKNQQEASALLVQQITAVNSTQVFDQLLIPALNYTRRDVHRGHLSEEECDALLQVLRKSFSDARCQPERLTEGRDDPVNETPPQQLMKQLTLLGCPADGDVDRTAIEMLRVLLDPTQWNLECTSEEMLTSEIADRIVTDVPAAICIVSLPPGSIAHARYLCKRFRSSSPDIPIIIGRWGRRIRPVDRERLLDAGATAVLATLDETRLWLNSRYPILEQEQLVDDVAITTRPNDRLPVMSR